MSETFSGTVTIVDSQGRQVFHFDSNSALLDIGATGSATGSATSSATVKTLPDSGGGTWLALPAALALMGCGLGALALVRRSAA